MKIFIILFFCIFSFSFQIIQAAFFCDELLREVYLVDKSTGESSQIAHGPYNGDWRDPNYFLNLAADQGDKIKINCYTNNADSNTYGGGCFLINDNCRCYDFNKEMTPYRPYTRSANLDGKDCSITLGRSEVPPGTYSYQYTIPLDTGGITCKYHTLFLAYGQNNDLNFSNYITANFGLKNLEISIIENYQYFKLNGVQLDSNKRFNILNDILNFYLEENKKFRITFRNFGIAFDNKDCILYIRVCHPRCSNCYDEDSDENNHQCRKCKEEYYPIEDNITNCYKIEEMIGSNYYFDEDEKIFKRCYRTCATCSSKSSENNNNCIICADSYHFIYNEIDKRNCIPETQKPTNTFLDNSTNTYKLCFGRCNRCSQIGDTDNNNCDECEKNDNGNYKYHFLENDNGNCIDEGEKPSNTYFDSDDNTYKYCYKRCSLCDKGGDASANNCNECLKDENDNYIYHFVYNETGREDVLVIMK